MRTEITVDAVSRTPTANMSRGGVSIRVCSVKERTERRQGTRRRKLTMHINTSNRRRRSQLLQPALGLIRLDDGV